jgi:hypothetical protein
MLEDREIDRINKPKKNDKKVIQGEKQLESWRKPIKINDKDSKVRKV